MDGLEKGAEVVVRKKPLEGDGGRAFRRRPFRAKVVEVRPDQGGAVVIEDGTEATHFATFAEIAAPGAPARADHEARGGEVDGMVAKTETPEAPALRKGSHGGVRVDGSVYPSLNAAGVALFGGKVKRGTKAWLAAFARAGKPVEFVGDGPPRGTAPEARPRKPKAAAKPRKAGRKRRAAKAA